MLHPTFLDLPKTNQGEFIIEVPAESHHQGLLKHLFHEIWHQVCKASCFRLTFYTISCSHAVTIPGSVARLYWKGNSPTRAGGQGKPSRTRLFKLLALAGMAGSNLAALLCFWDFAAAYISNVSGCVRIHLQLCGMSLSGTFTMTLVRVLTGRRHQIRSHCMQIGHPTVSDGRYTSTATFQTDTAFCPRNFLHRPGNAKST